MRPADEATWCGTDGGAPTGVGVSRGAARERGALATLDTRIAATERAADTTDELRELALLRRQRVALEHVGRQRETLRRQLDNAGLALTTLRLDLVELHTSGIGAGLGEVTSATQDARALSKEIGMALESVMEVRKL